ncbi:MAG TPA: ABC-type transport auxiliary lipoprotein family protein [Sphingomicrobium sp.]|nr:ABC-type transport auxiliary lipoprotein family protein [Sphingomicrobium sp.]
MRLLTRTGTAIILAAALGGCSLGGLLGGGGKPPATLVTLMPEAPAPAQMVRNAAVAQSVTIAIPTVPKELTFVRVPVQLTPTNVQYVTNLQLVDTPNRLFQGLLEETVRRTTNRVVLDPAQSTVDPGMTIGGQLQRFGYDASTGAVVVTYDATMAKAGGAGVQTRRFSASAPADGSALTVGPALNRAANQVALDVARWIGG